MIITVSGRMLKANKPLQKPNNTLKQSKTEAVDALEDNVSAAFSFYIIGKFDIRRTLDKKSPHKSGHRKQTID